MSASGGLPPLPPLTPPTPVTNSPLNAELAAQGRRAGLRAAFLTKLGMNIKSPSNKSTKLGG
jgi:hypothetical protein